MEKILRERFEIPSDFDNLNIAKSIMVQKISNGQTEKIVNQFGLYY